MSALVPYIENSTLLQCRRNLVSGGFVNHAG
jgi:hypothetical protein